jgi:hypothetical protein
MLNSLYNAAILVQLLFCHRKAYHASTLFFASRIAAVSPDLEKRLFSAVVFLIGNKVNSLTAALAEGTPK